MPSGSLWLFEIMPFCFVATRSTLWRGFDKALDKTGMMKSTMIVPLDSIFEISYSEASESAKIQYINEKDKQKKINFEFGDVSLSNAFAEFLGEKLNLNKVSTQEGKVLPLLKNFLFLAIALVATYYLANIDPASLAEGGSTNRTRGRAIILAKVVGFLGQTGVYIVGGLITLSIAYNLYRRFQTPANKVVYSK